MAEPTHPRPLPPEELGFETIVYAKEPPRATITLNRPDVLNAFDFRMLREIARACEDAATMGIPFSAQVVVIEE